MKRLKLSLLFITLALGTVMPGYGMFTLSDDNETATDYVDIYVDINDIPDDLQTELEAKRQSAPQPAVRSQTPALIPPPTLTSALEAFERHNSALAPHAHSAGPGRKKEAAPKTDDNQIEGLISQLTKFGISKEAQKFLVDLIKMSAREVKGVVQGSKRLLMLTQVERNIQGVRDHLDSLLMHDSSNNAEAQQKAAAAEPAPNMEEEAAKILRDTQVKLEESKKSLSSLCVDLKTASENSLYDSSLLKAQFNEAVTLWYELPDVMTRTADAGLGLAPQQSKKAFDVLFELQQPLTKFHRKIRTFIDQYKEEDGVGMLAKATEIATNFPVDFGNNILSSLRELVGYNIIMKTRERIKHIIDNDSALDDDEFITLVHNVKTNVTLCLHHMALENSGAKIELQVLLGQFPSDDDRQTILRYLTHQYGLLTAFVDTKGGLMNVVQCMVDTILTNLRELTGYKAFMQIRDDMQAIIASSNDDVFNEKVTDLKNYVSKILATLHPTSEMLPFLHTLNKTLSEAEEDKEQLLEQLTQRLAELKVLLDTKGGLMSVVEHMGDNFGKRMHEVTDGLQAKMNTVFAVNTTNNLSKSFDRAIAKTTFSGIFGGLAFVSARYLYLQEKPTSHHYAKGLGGFFGSLGCMWLTHKLIDRKYPQHS